MTTSAMKVIRVTMVTIAAFSVHACASGRSPVYSASAVDQPAELVGCSTEELGVGPSVVVRLSMVVDEEGKVVSARKSHRRGQADEPRGIAARQGLVQAAQEIARSCVYRPAMLNGVPVRSRVTRTFTFPYTPGYHTPPMGGGGPDTSGIVGID